MFQFPVTLFPHAAGAPFNYSVAIGPSSTGPFGTPTFTRATVADFYAAYSGSLLQFSAANGGLAQLPSAPTFTRATVADYIHN